MQLLVLLSSIMQKTGAMCKKTGIFKPLRIQLKCRSCFRSNFSSIEPPAAGQLRSFYLPFENYSYQISYFLEPFEGIKLQKCEGQLKN